MTFISPLWLLALLPWIAIVVILLSGRRERAAVPFLNLWQSPEELPRPQRSIQRPPAWLILMLLAMLLAIFAAGRPRLKFIHRSIGPPITIIVDRGFTMSANWKQLVESAHDEIAAQLGEGPVDLILVPDGHSTQCDRSNWASIALGQSSTDQDTREMLRQIVQSSPHDSPLIVLSDQAIEDSHVIQIPPPTQPRNVGIVNVAASDSPSPQIMVRVRNDSELQIVKVRIESVEKEIALPPRGQEGNYFFDVAKIGAATNVDLVVEDNFPADNHAMLRKRQSWPMIQAGSQLPAEVQRMIQTYAKLRPADEASMHVEVGSENEQAAVIVANDANEKIVGDVRVGDHPIAVNVDWHKVLRDALAAKPQAAGTWQPIVSAGDDVLLAVRELPMRQVWIGFDSPTFSHSSDFVIFWTNVLDWVGHGGDAYAADGPHAVAIPPLVHSDWKSKLRALPATYRAGFEAAPPLLVGAVLLILAALVVLGLAKPQRAVNISVS